MGIKEQIKRSESEDEILKLLSIGNSYKSASNGTRKSWLAAAAVRMQMPKYKPESK